MVRVLLLAPVILLLPALAADAPPLPEPLTLEAALALADAPHPDLARARGELDLSIAERDGVEADSGLTATLQARLRWFEMNRDFEAEFGESDRPQDHAAGLVVRKRLYDFGYTDARREAARAEVARRERQLVDARTQRRLEIITRYFDVLLADLRYARDNEAMAVAYIELDRLRDRHELEQVSDLALLEAESGYQALLTRRNASSAARRSTRARLASALGRPGQLSANLSVPALGGNTRPLPDLSELESTALERNPGLLALRHRVEAARKHLRAAGLADAPVITGEAGASAYTRDLRTNDPLGAGIYLEIPLYTGGRSEARSAQSRAELGVAEADLAGRELEVRQALLDLWLEIDTLRSQRQEADTLARYRELYLDRSRALYEMEVRADLGDALVRSTEARLRAAETEYAIALARARLDALLGVDPDALAEGLSGGGAAP